MSNSDIENYVKNLDSIAKQIKDEIFRLSWYMRGGISAQDLFHIYSFEDRSIISNIIKENVEATKKSGMPLI
jgi:hypothetical protein